MRRSRTKRTYNAKGCEATNEAKLRVPPSPPRQNKLHIVCDAFTSPLHSFRCFSSSPKSRLFGDPIFNKRNFLRKNIRRCSKPHCPCFVRRSRTKRTYNAKGCEATNEAKLWVSPSPPRQNKLHIVCDGTVFYRRAGACSRR